MTLVIALRTRMDIAARRLRTLKTPSLKQRHRAMGLERVVPDPAALLVIDEADRLKIAGLEQTRSIFDQSGIGMILIGMPGIEKHLARYPQFLLPHRLRP